VNSRPNTLTTRLAHLALPYRNSLARGSDKLESATLTFTVIAALLLGPIMLVFGSIVHADMVETAGQQERTRHPAVAVLAQDAPDTSVDGRGNAVIGKAMVLATWDRADGTTGGGLVEASTGLNAGSKVGIWLDERGRVVDRPLSRADAAAGGVMVALAGWVGAVVLLGCAQAGVHFLLNRRRYLAWERQWERVEPGWNNYRRS
jgi:hypothetical protein